MTTNELTPINVDELLTRCMGQLDFAQEILDDFMESCQRGIDNLRSLDNPSANVTEIERLRAEAHRLKGTSATVAANQLADLFEELESDIKSGNTMDAANRFPSVETEFRNVRRFIKSHFKAEHA